MADRQRPKATSSKEVPWTLPNLIKAVNFNLKFRRDKRAHNKDRSPRLESARQEVTPEQVLINSMTNWQRNQWAKAGYRKKHITKFANMQRPNRAEA